MANEQRRPHEPDPNRGNTGNIGHPGSGQSQDPDRGERRDQEQHRDQPQHRDQGQRRDQGSNMNRDRSGKGRQGGMPGGTPVSHRERDMDRDRDIEE